MAEAVEAVRGHGHDVDPATAECLSDLPRRRNVTVEVQHRWQVLDDEPLRAVHLMVEGEDDDWSSYDTTKLSKASQRIRPMVHGQQRHPGIEDSVGERKLGCHCADRGRATRHPLPDHLQRRLHGDHFAVAWLVRSRTSADIDHAGCVSERFVQHPLDASIALAEPSVANTDRVVER
jgi:hypothetical protein